MYDAGFLKTLNVTIYFRYFNHLTFRMLNNDVVKTHEKNILYLCRVLV